MKQKTANFSPGLIGWIVLLTSTVKDRLTETPAEPFIPAHAGIQSSFTDHSPPAHRITPPQPCTTSTDTYPSDQTDPSDQFSSSPNQDQEEPRKTRQDESAKTLSLRSRITPSLPHQDRHLTI